MRNATRLDIFEELAKMKPEARAQVKRKAYAGGYGQTLEQFDADFEKYLADKAAQVPVVVPWRKKFHTGEELAEGDVKIYVDKFLPEGVTFLGSLSGVGKSWLGLSLAKALTTGEPFMNVFHVTEAVPCIYLVPEMSDRAIRRRIEKLKMPMKEMFFCQTISDGICRLDDSVLKAAIEEIHPVVFLDTAIRFSLAGDENAASDNSRTLSFGVIRFLQWGCRAVVALHHSPKSSGESEMMTLENTLRGSGDIGAVCDCVWALRHDRRMKGRKLDVEYLLESMRSTRIFCMNVKARDFQPAAPFTIVGRPHLDQKGDFAVTTSQDSRSIEEQVLDAISADPKRTITSIKDQFGVGFDRVVGIAKQNSWMQTDGIWTRSVAPTVSEPLPIQNPERKIPF